MNCFSELDYSIYVDGEASAQQSRLIETHLETCGRCRVLTDVLRSENLLFSLLLSKEEAPQAAAAKAGSWSWIVAALASMALFWQAASWLLAQVELPSAVAWLNPSSRDLYWTLATSAVFSSTDWAALAGQLVMAVLAAAVVAGVVAAGWYARPWMPTSAMALASFALVFVMLSPAHAIERRKANIVTVGSGETVNDTLIVTAQEADIAGTINGDLIAFGRYIAVSGNVKGDVIAFSRNLDVKGKVEGNIYSFAQSARIEGQAARNVIGFVQTLELPAQGRVGYDLITFTEDAELSGAVGRDIAAFGESISMRGNIGRNVSVFAKNVTLSSSARVSGDFKARVRKKENVHIADGAVISGKTDVQIRTERSRYERPGFYFWKLITLLGAWIVGLLLAALFPSAFAFVPRNSSDWGLKAGIGFLVLVATPIAACILAVTLIGLPLALISFALWLLALYLAKILVSAAIAQAAFKPANNGPRAMALPLLAALALVWLLTNVPFIGGLLSLLVCIAGLGIVFVWWRSRITPQAVVST
jgi:cytoskeletal protein CcmA (bactofilin family)